MYLALEGSSVTLLGLVKYDAKHDSITMTHLASILGGGLQEARRCLKERLEGLETQLYWLIVGGFLFTGMGALGHYAFYYAMRE